MRALKSLTLVASLWASGCTAARTQIVVRLDTDIALGPGGLTTVALDVLSQDHLLRAHYPLRVGATGTDAVATLPADLFAITPLNGDTSRAVTVVATALSGQTTLLTVTATASFTPGATTLLGIFLAEQCRLRATPCPSGQSCGAGGVCMPDVRPTLPLLSSTPLPDGGTRDAGADVSAAPDVGTTSDVPDVMAPPDVPAVPDVVAPPVCNSNGACEAGETACNCPTDNCVATGTDGCCSSGENHCTDAHCSTASQGANGCCEDGETHCSDSACPDVSHGANGCCEAGENYCSDNSCAPTAVSDGCCSPGEMFPAEPACPSTCGDGYCNRPSENCTSCPADCHEQMCQCYVRCCDGNLLGPGSPGFYQETAAACAAHFRTNPCGSGGSVRAAWGAGAGVCADARSSKCSCCPSSGSGMGSCGVASACTTLSGC